MFSWFDSYDIYDESGNTVFTVKGQFSWGHCFKIFDAEGNKVGEVRQRLFTFMPKFELYRGDSYVGCISKEIWNWTDTYSIIVGDTVNALGVLMLVLAIDAEKCSRNN